MSKTILCADDSATMQTVAEITFRATEYEYVGARSANEAIEKARASKPTLVLADAVMPDKDGYELCELLKKDPDLSDVPVMMMCGKSQEYDSQRGSQVGADGHVIKPWDSQVMLDTVEALLKRVSAEGVAAPGAGKTAPAPPPVTPASAGRSATIMGMPTIKMPPKKPTMPGVVTPIKPAMPAAPVVPPVIPTVPTAATKPAEPSPPPPAKLAVPPAAAAPAAAARPPAAAPPTTASSASLPPPPKGMPRPPMLRGVPTKRPAVVPRRPVQPVMHAVPATVAAAAAEAGLKPTGPEVQALMKLSREVVERIVWEVVPELAETIIKENLDKLAAKPQ